MVCVERSSEEDDDVVVERADARLFGRKSYEETIFQTCGDLVGMVRIKESSFAKGQYADSATARSESRMQRKADWEFTWVLLSGKLHALSYLLFKAMAASKLSRREKPLS
jgi:hypothetical protein